MKEYKRYGKNTVRLPRQYLPFPYVRVHPSGHGCKRGIADQFEIASAATSREEIGNPVYPPAVRKLREHGIDPSGKRARQMTKQDYEYYDYLLTAEQYNIQNMLRIVGGDPEHKIHRLLDYSKHPRDIDDPWYSGDFETAYRDIVEGCEAFLESFK